MRFQLKRRLTTAMGLTYTTVRVQGLDERSEPYEGRFLVDTGATDCLAPRTALLNAGVKPRGRGQFELANGARLELEYGHAFIRFMESEGTARFIFGPDEVEPILGVLALESAGVVVDPNTQTLKRL